MAPNLYTHNDDPWTHVVYEGEKGHEIERQHRGVDGELQWADASEELGE